MQARIASGSTPGTRGKVRATLCSLDSGHFKKCRSGKRYTGLKNGKHRFRVEVKGIDQKGMYHDGGGLYLQVTPSGSKTWIFRFRSPLTQKLRDMGAIVTPDTPFDVDNVFDIE